MKYVILPLSAFVRVDLQRTIQAFVKLGVSPWLILRHWRKINKIMTQYRLGRFDDTAAFKAALQKIFPKLPVDESFDRAFCAMCEINSQTSAAFTEIAQLPSSIRVYLIAGTNPLHWAHIVRNVPSISGIPFLSFEKHKLEGALRADILAEIRKDMPTASQVDISFVYYERELPSLKQWFNSIRNWDKSDWILSLLYFHEFVMARLYTHNLKKGAKHQGFSLAKFSPGTCESFRGFLVTATKWLVLRPQVERRLASASPSSDEVDTVSSPLTPAFNSQQPSDNKTIAPPSTPDLGAPQLIARRVKLTS